MGTLRRFAFGLVAAVALLVALPQAASAEELPVSGSFTGRGQLLGGCGVFHQVVDGGGEWTTLGPTTFHWDFCLGADPGTGLWPAAGTFSLTAADGTLTGDLAGWVAPGGGGPFPLELGLTVTGGTGRYEGATGLITAVGSFGLGAATVQGTVDGTIDVRRPTPDGIDDCRDGGWRDHADEHGDPFRNQGDCVAWVRHHT